MSKLEEIKNWLPYLGNNVTQIKTERWSRTFSCQQNHNVDFSASFLKLYESDYYDNCFLILKPLQELSDFVQTEFINYGMGMQYNEEIVNLFCLEFTHSEEKLIDLDLTTLPYKCAEYFFKYGYDFFGLIPKGLAVDINTLSVE